ncbi:arylsulfatase [Novosphingobium colocasiae]|uniref:Arylsulfatase n=1 Tax=Novosphingobium colocasiae TaxID=1256513 RepID=A0A918UI38_9SPHN|nr:arylsulfatase [Novosphingobium colocasiae]
MPNIILILADDFGVEGVNAYGGEYYTPNIDRLSREGTRFDNAHAMPLCSPSRVRLMTGQDNHRNYEAFGYLAPGQRTFANVLKDAGYATGIVGKWQLMGNGFDGRVGITPEAAGFDEYYLWQLRALDRHGSRYWGPTRVSNNGTKINEEGFGPDLDASFAVDFIHRNKDRPFFLYYSMVLVHNPFVPTPDSMQAKGDKNRFAAMVTYMDKEVGDVMDALRREGLDKNTVVIFTGDNGTNRAITTMRDGVPVQGGKGTPTINGTHVPLIAWAPGRVPVGKVSAALFDFADFLPTFAEIGGRAVKPGTIDGVSQWSVMQGKAKTARETIFQHYAPAWVFEPARFAFDAEWKLYGDGRFVHMNPLSGVETEVDAVRAGGEAAKHKARLARVMATANDGPLDSTRYPWCVKQDSKSPTLPATVAGCAHMPQGEE